MPRMRVQPKSARNAVATERMGLDAVARAPGAWLGAGLASALLWSYWPTITELVTFWQRNQDYSVGMLVPPVAVYLVWRERAQLRLDRWSFSWLGVGALVLVECVRLAGIYFGVGSAANCALVGALAATALAVAGWRVFRRLKWVWLFLLLMVPWPARIHEAVAVPLQTLATRSAVFGLELAGFFVIREGNVLRLENGQVVGVAEACSGLRMLTAFVFVAAVLAFLVGRPAWQKAALVLASVPIAVACNCLRVIATSIFVYYSESPALTEAFHDGAGLAMMPLAIVACLGLLKLFAFLEAEGEPGGKGGGIATKRQCRA
jgi:exosortase